jgi:hypothetical protein
MTAARLFPILRREALSHAVGVLNGLPIYEFHDDITEAAMADEKRKEQPAPYPVQHPPPIPPHDTVPVVPPTTTAADRPSQSELEARQKAISPTRKRVGPPLEEPDATPVPSPDVPKTDCAPPKHR